MTQGEQAEQPKRLAMILPHLGVGGAQRVAAMLANRWANQGLDVHFVTLLDRPEDFYTLDPLVERYVLQKHKNDKLQGLRREPGAYLSATPQESRVDKFRFTAEQYLQKRLADKQSHAGGQESATVQALKSGDIRSILLLFPLVALNIAKNLSRRTVKLATSIAKKSAEYGIHNASSYIFSKAYLLLLRASFWRIKALRTLLQRLNPDAVVSFLGATNIITIAATRGLTTRVVISERNDPARQELESPWQGLRPIIYPLADVVTANSHGALESMESYCSKAQLAYVPNPIVVSQTANESRDYSIIFLGRLVPQKAPDILIEAFALFAKEHPDWTLQIVGDGPSENELVDQARDLGIADRVVFHGLVKDPIPLLTQSRIFALPSRFEGTPNALLEAMASGLACVVSDASPGPLRLIEHGTNGLVVKVDDPEDLATALASLAREPLLVEQFGKAACDGIEEFRIDRVAADWERLLFGERVHP